MTDQNRKIVAASFTTPDGGSRGGGALGGAFPDKVGNVAVLHVKPDGKPKFIEFEGLGRRSRRAARRRDRHHRRPHRHRRRRQRRRARIEAARLGLRTTTSSSSAGRSGPNNWAVVVEIAADAVPTAQKLLEVLGAGAVVVEDVETSVAGLFDADEAPTGVGAGGRGVR